MLGMVCPLIFLEEQLFIDRIVDGVCKSTLPLFFLPQTTLLILFSNYLPIVFPPPLNCNCQKISHLALSSLYIFYYCYYSLISHLSFSHLSHFCIIIFTGLRSLNA